MARFFKDMTQTDRTLVIMLSMHRSGSSLAASVFHAHGMSLGPFELLGAAPSNRHGHFEAVPFLELGRTVQKLTYGFSEAVPDSRETVSSFINSRGAWNDVGGGPDELVE
jgi:hypothetical protein